MSSLLSHGLPHPGRVAIARAALTAARWVRGDHPVIADEAVMDLLADLRHFCAARRIDFNACTVASEQCFQSELDGGVR